MKILITGAHFTPAVAVAQELKKNPDVKIVYVGRRTTQEGDPNPSAESKILPTLGIKFIPIITGRLQRSFTLYTIPSLLKIPIGILQSLYILLTEKPDVVLSFGGYVSVPVVIMGWLFSIPIIVHEQTLVSGLASKISAVFADKIALSFPKNSALTPKTIITGNPIRKEILDVKISHIKKEKPLILITGGNQGSHAINLAVEQSLNDLTKIATVIHVTGDNKYQDFERLERSANNSYVVKKWVSSEWGPLLSKVDLVISRAGINTLTELAFLGIPALVVPIPYLYGDEQNVNAKYFQKLGLVEILPQSKLAKNSLMENVKLMIKKLPELKQKAKNAKLAVIEDAAPRLALETLLLVKDLI